VDVTGWSVGVDLGGTNLRVALYRDLDADGGAPVPVAEQRAAVGGERAPAQVAVRLAEAVAEVCAAGGAEAAGAPVGVGLAAMLDPRPGWVANSPHFGWRGVDFLSALRAVLGDERRIGLYNDVDAVTWGELMLGAGRGARDLLAVFVGTGIGSGIVAAGQLVTGAHRCAAELAAAGDPWAALVIAEAGELLGLTLANAVTLLDPQRLILGGGVWSNAPTLRAAAITALRRLANPPALEDLIVVDAALGDDAGVVGSALLVNAA
jgi:glucokinase